MKQTVLHQKHLQMKAKLTEFRGWQVPLQFSDVQDEYHAVRSAVGLFDVSYLGRIEVAGPGASVVLQKTFTRNIAKISEGTAHYGFFCTEAGNILADALLFLLPGKPSNKRYLITTSAGNAGKILAWLKQYATADVEITDRTDFLVQIALQGPKSFSLLEKLSGQPLKKFKPRSIRELSLLNTPILASRTGYTGEHGYELFAPADLAEQLWDALMAAGSSDGLLACGLSCRDMLRMEKGFLLYGNDIDETRTPIEAGQAAFVDLKKEFIGRDSLLKLTANGVQQKLVGFVLFEKGTPRTGGSIYSENHEIGIVTSGGHSSHLRKSIGLGYVAPRYAQPGLEIEIETKDREMAAKIAELPFFGKK